MLLIAGGPMAVIMVGAAPFAHIPHGIFVAHDLRNAIAASWRRCS